MIKSDSRAESSPTAVEAAETLVDMLDRYGLDARSLSGLKACFRHEGASGPAGRREAIKHSLLEADPNCTADMEALNRFLDSFIALSEADFSAEWVDKLVRDWRALRRSGCANDLPYRAAAALTSHASRRLLGDRSSLSALEVEILGALSTAGICLAEFLGRTMRRGGGAMPIEDIVDRGQGRVLVDRLADVLAKDREGGTEGEGWTVGLIAFQFHLGPAALTLPREQRDQLADDAVARISAILRSSDILVRTEAHAGAAILPGLHTHAQVRLAASKMAQVFERPFSLPSAEIRLSFALGAVWMADSRDTAEELVRYAELAVSAAVRENKAIVFFDDSLLAAARQEVLIDKEFVDALETGRIALHVQPQIDLRTGRCVGGELLLRWIDGGGVEVPAAHVPEIAWRLGMAPQLTRWLLFSACRTLAELIKAGIDIHLSVNLTGRDLMDEELPLLVEQAIGFWRVPPSKLTFELIESAVLEDPVVGAAVMNRLIELGVSTSIDDFGIAYSSILYLRQLSLDELKIDRAFVDSMSRSREDKEIVGALIRLAHGLDLRVVAEGIEDEHTAALLSEMGCDSGQGYWIARAMPTEEMPAWLAEWNRRAASSPVFRATVVSS